MGQWNISDGVSFERVGRASTPQPRPPPRDNRREQRYRTQLRSGRIYDQHQRFICACVVRDRSSQGARLLLPKNVTPPRQICFLDEELGEVFRAEVRWRQDREIGILKLGELRTLRLF